MTTDSLSQRQSDVVTALESRSTNLAGAYRSALSVLETPAEPGLESARVAIASHCMRELMNGLPSVLAETSIPRISPSSDALMAALPDLYDKLGGLDLEANLGLVPVPKKLARAIAKLVSTVRQENSRNQLNAAALLTDGSNARHPVLTQWRDAQRFFLEWTHFDRNQAGARALPTDDEICAHIEVVEDIILNRTAAFFDAVDVVQSILAKANSRTGEVPA